MKKRNKYFLYACLVVLLIVCIIAEIKNADKYSLLDSIAMLAFGIIPIGLALLIDILSRVKRNAKRDLELRMRAENEHQTNVMIDNLKNGLPVLNVPNFYIGDAVLHFFQPAILAKTENKMVGMVNETTAFTDEHFGIHNIFIHPEHEQFKTTSKGKSKAIYNDVTNIFNGQLALTNKSILFINQQKGFEIKINELSFVHEIVNGLSLQAGDRVYTVLFDKSRYFLAILNMVKNIN